MKSQNFSGAAGVREWENSFESILSSILLSKVAKKLLENSLRGMKARVQLSGELFSEAVSCGSVRWSAWCQECF
jgi:hypothetical protein